MVNVAKTLADAITSDWQPRWSWWWGCSASVGRPTPPSPWPPYSATARWTFSLRSIGQQSWISRRNSDWFFAEHPVVHNSTATPVCQVGDSVEPSDIPRHEPHGEYLHYQHQYQEYLHYQHQYQKHIWRQIHDRHQCSVILLFMVIVD